MERAIWWLKIGVLTDWALSQLPGRGTLGVAVSRVQKSGTGEIHETTENMTVHCGDILVVVGLRWSAGRVHASGGPSQ